LNLQKVTKVLQAVANFTAPKGDLRSLDTWVMSQYNPMREYLKTLLFSDAVSNSHAEAAVVPESFNAIIDEVRTIDLKGHNVKLLVALNRTVGNYMGRFLCFNWLSDLKTPRDAAQPAVSVTAEKSTSSPRLPASSPKLQMLLAGNSMSKDAQSSKETSQTLEAKDREIERLSKEVSELRAIIDRQRGDYDALRLNATKAVEDAHAMKAMCVALYGPPTKGGSDSSSSDEGDSSRRGSGLRRQSAGGSSNPLMSLPPAHRRARFADGSSHRFPGLVAPSREKAPIFGCPLDSFVYSPS